MISHAKKKPNRLIRQKDKGLVSPGTRMDEEEEDYMDPSDFSLSDVFSIMNQRDQTELEDRGILIIDRIISKDSLAKISKRMLVLHFDKEFKDEIQIILNSPGGYCDAGWALIDLMGFVKNRVKTVAMGEICSMATSIFIAGDDRVMSPNCSAMIHQFSDYGEGKYDELIAKGKMWEMEMEKEVAHLIRCSKYTNKAQVEKNLLKGNDHWLSPNEMKKHGLCDQVFKPKARGKK